MKKKPKTESHNIQKRINITRAYQVGKPIHIVYTFNGQVTLLTMKAGRKLIKLINDYYNNMEDEKI